MTEMVAGTFLSIFDEKADNPRLTLQVWRSGTL
jgi:hypothetical protein